MLLYFTHKSHIATLRSEYHAVACAVYDDWPILDCKGTKSL